MAFASESLFYVGTTQGEVIRAAKSGTTWTQTRIDNVPAGAETWEKAIRKLRGGMMPPLGAPRPDQANIEGLVAFLESSIDRVATSGCRRSRSPRRTRRTRCAP